MRYTAMPLHGEADPAPDYPEYADLIAAARARTGRMVDPAELRRLERALGERGWDWCTSVIGYPYPGLGRITGTMADLLLLAHDADVRPPLPPAIAEQRAAKLAAEQARRLEQGIAEARRWNVWRDLVAAFPVPVTVGYNYSRYTYEFYTAGADHVVTSAEYRHGRLVRPAGRALCETGRFRLELHDTHDPTTRLATCKACLRVMARHTPTLDVGPLLNRPHASHL